MHYLVTGGAGFIGTNLCERLVADGHQVTALDNLSVTNSNVDFLTSIGVDVAVQDIVYFDKIEPLFKDVDVVIHLAAMNRAQKSIQDPLKANAVNIDGTLNCLEAARQNQASRFINISSSSVYASQRDVLLEEDMPLAPPHPYGIGKLAGEHYARIYNEVYKIPTTSLRFFSVYGPRQLGDIDKAGVVAKFIHHAMTDLPLEIYGNGKQLRNFSFVDDVVECIVRASVTPEANGEIINVASTNEVSVNLLAGVVSKITQKEPTIVHGDPLVGDPSRNPANTDKCQQILGYVPTTSFEAGVAKTLEWYCACSDIVDEN